MVARAAAQIAQLASICLIASSPSNARSCVNFDAARKASYVPYIQLVLGDIESIKRGRGDADFNAAIGELGNTYARGANFGDNVAIRKLIGIGLFTAMVANTEPLDVTFRLACESAKQQLPPRNVLDPLICAVIAVDRSRGDKPANRPLATDMIELAKSNLASDPNATAARTLFATVSGPVMSCLSQP
jgi:hypothetical protein